LAAGVKMQVAGPIPEFVREGFGGVSSLPGREMLRVNTQLVDHDSEIAAKLVSR
jgi:hypothetical protein